MPAGLGRTLELIFSLIALNPGESGWFHPSSLVHSVGKRQGRRRSRTPAMENDQASGVPECRNRISRLSVSHQALQLFNDQALKCSYCGPAEPRNPGTSELGQVPSLVHPRIMRLRHDLPSAPFLTSTNGISMGPTSRPAPSGSDRSCLRPRADRHRVELAWTDLDQRHLDGCGIGDADGSRCDGARAAAPRGPWDR